MYGPQLTGCAIILSLLIAGGGAEARPLHVVGSPPGAQIYFTGPNAQYVVRFDGPVDHRSSVLFITRGNTVIQTLPPSHDTEANVLAGAAPRPASGDYVLHWVVRSFPDGQETEGSSNFSVPK